MNYKSFSADLFGTPGQERFDLLLEPLGRESVGAFIVVDSTQPETFVRAKEMIRKCHVEGLPKVIVANKQNMDGALSPEEIREKMKLPDEISLMEFLRRMSERIGRPVSEAHPIVDGALPDGSRINIIFSNDVSRRGSSFTIRKFSSTPISIVQLVQWGTMSAEIAGYLWLCLENGMSLFVCGETASGKTTALNAMLPFILPQSKIFTAEDTAEVLPPHEIWQQLITREEGPEDSRVTLFDLLKAALRSRPNYIIVGEIRGAEGAVAFQAMQTGHPVLATFHASSVKKMIQRFTGDPINVPITFMDNLNIALIQQAVYRKGKFLRRCTSIEELEGYYEDAGGIVTRAVFQWDPGMDRHFFRGMNNSYILENKIAERLGYEDKRQIYEDMMFRARIIARMAELNITDYFKVNEIIRNFYLKGPESLPFQL
ncbi:MAG: ATPase, T2SS/T4P/T4SS family [Candidatus Syntropharchaeia archaeon]